jgi:RloB-like protein
MPRARKGLVRKSGGQSKDPYVIFVIATEGLDTEPAYFRHIKTRLERLGLDRLVKIETLERMRLNPAGETEKDTRSDVRYVLDMLDGYSKKYTIQTGDELWCVIDRDRWPNRNIAAAAQHCLQKDYEFCATTPCFECWLLLHFADFNHFSKEEYAEIIDNKRNNPGNRTRAEHLLNEWMKANGIGAYKKNHLPDLSEHIEYAVNQAFRLALEDGHWQDNLLCTRLHVLLQRIFKINLNV